MQGGQGVPGFLALARVGGDRRREPSGEAGVVCRQGVPGAKPNAAKERGQDRVLRITRIFSKALPLHSVFGGFSAWATVAECQRLGA